MAATLTGESGADTFLMGETGVGGWTSEAAEAEGETRDGRFLLFGFLARSRVGYKKDACG